MELKYLQTFKTILEEGSFVSAAKKLNYTQSTVTFQIQQLEQELSIKLFEKIGRKMTLTQAGKEIIPFVDTILETVTQLENCGKETGDLQGSLKVALPETLLTYQMQPVLKAFREQAPNVKLSLEALNCYKIREQITNGSVDIGVHYDVGGYGSSVLFEELTEYSLSLVSSPLIEEIESDFMKGRQRKNICLLLNDRGSIYFKLIEAYFREIDITFSGILELGSIEATKRSAVSNLGVAYLPQFVVADELKVGALKELNTGLDNVKIKAVCAYHKNKWITPAMELFIKLLKEYMKK